MNTFQQPDGRPPLPLPEGWKAGWSEQYEEHFYVNLSTGQSQWEKPTQPVPRSSANEEVSSSGTTGYSDKVFVEHSDKVFVNHSDKIHSQSSELPSQSSNNGIHPDQGFRSEPDLLSEFEFKDPNAITTLATAGEVTGWSRKRSCRVMVRKFSKQDEDALAKADREITALGSLSDPAIPPVLDVFDSPAARFIVLENRRDESLKQYIQGHGTLAPDLLKAITTQMFAALAAIFMAGFTHLRICDETLFIDKTGQLTIKHFDYAHVYNKAVDGSLYAQVEAKYGSDLYVAPEVSAATTYNGRKATLWSCGIAIYYMTTGQLEKLSTIEHPLNGNMQPTSIAGSPAHSRQGSLAAADGQPPPSPQAQQRRRSSLGGRKFSLSSAQQLVIPYPGSTRFDVPPWARDIISKLLITNPLKRAELIEAATKVPKEAATKATRPLVELAWLDYKTHVGPLAGQLNEVPELASSASSIYSGISNFSNPFASLLGGRRRSSSKNTPYANYA